MAVKRRGLRKGWTTGSCAAAAAKAAAHLLVGQEPVVTVEIGLPIGQRATFSVHRQERGDGWAACSIIKDAGDDPDVTHGAEICSRVAWSREPGLHLRAGPGVGTVTRPGIGLPVGDPAINPVPRQMIAAALGEVIEVGVGGRGVEVIVSVPGGEELAKKTLNPRIGILGGISILGTTGIVRPFSTAAYRASVGQAIGVAAANGCREVAMTTGGKTERFAMKLFPRLPEVAFIEMGDFLGYALKACVRAGINKAILVAMIGKLSKMATGTMQTHAAGSSVDLDFLADVAGRCGASEAAQAEIRASTMARRFSEIANEQGFTGVFDLLCQMVCEHARRHVRGALAIECVLVDFDQGIPWGRASTGEQP